MKKYLITAAALAALTFLASCGKDNVPSISNGEEDLQQGQSLVTVNAIAAFDTKATGVADDATDTKKVSSLQVFAFDAGGILRSYENTTSGSSLSMKLNSGQSYTFYAVANNAATGGGWKYPAVGAVTSEGGFSSIMTDLKDNAKDNLLMFSQSGTKHTVSGSSSSITVEVTRLVSKIQIKKVTVDFGTNATLKSKSFKMDSVYVINAVRNESLALAPASTQTYYNKARFIAGNADALLCDKLATPFELSTSSGVVTAYTTAHTFFAYGNATSGTTVTRLVVSCNWGGERTYYPINITGADSKLSPNCAYIVNQLTIKGLGSDDPNVVPERKDFSASITVKNWEAGFEKTVEL